MRVLITSDIHFGVPNKLEHSLWATKVVRAYAAAHDIEIVLVLGDLFHDRTSLNIQVLTTAYDFFDDTKKNYNQEWVVFPGNHDMFLKNSWEINSVRPLSPLITIIENIRGLKLGGRTFWILPFVHYEAAYMEVVRAIERKATPDDILLTHIGVTGASLNECFLLKHWSLVDFSKTKFARVYSGHFHCYQQVGTNTWYPGSPIPFRFDEGLVEHGFLEFDTDACEHKFIKIFEAAKQYLPNEQRAPDYLTCTDDNVEKMNVTDNNVRVLLSRDYTGNELHKLRLKIVERGARSVKWMKAKQEEDIELQQNSKTHMGDGTTLFPQWLKHDDPDHLDHTALIDLNKRIVEEGMERITSTEDPDGSSTAN